MLELSPHSTTSADQSQKETVVETGKKRFSEKDLRNLLNAFEPDIVSSQQSGDDAIAEDLMRKLLHIMAEEEGARALIERICRPLMDARTQVKHRLRFSTSQ